MATKIERKPIPPRRSLYEPDVQTQSVVYSRNTSEDKAIKRSRPRKGLVLCIFAAIATLLLLIGWFRFVLPWWQGITDHWQYGQARISQLDADIGHGGVSHFVAEYYKGQIVVIELSKTGTHVYALSGFYGAEGKPVITLSTEDVNGDHKPDIVVQIEDSHAALTLYNTGTALSERWPG